MNLSPGKALATGNRLLQEDIKVLGIIDYGSGNYSSVCNAFTHLGVKHRSVSDAESLVDCSHVVLPGVGAFHDCIKSLQQRGMLVPLKAMLEDNIFHFLGICVGHQVLAEAGSEFFEGPGLGVIPGTTDRLCDEGVRLPHVGWNELEFSRPSPIFEGIEAGSTVYFVHSFAIRNVPDDYIIAKTEYNQPITAAINKGLTYGVQFHPEKSQAVGLRVLKNFSELK